MAHAFAAGPSHRDPIDVAGRERMRTGGKRKLGSNSSSPSTAHAASPSKKKKKADPDSEAGEKRLRRFRPAPPRAWHDVYQRALTQRFYVLQRERCGTQECPEEHVEMTGSTGNIYNVHIGKLSTCDCPYANKGNECKHVLYILSQVLRAPYNLVYQRALVSSELRAIFDAAPPIPGAGFSTRGGDIQKRKTIEGDCPICFSQLKADSPDSITWCQATCGQNMHTKCFDVWACSKRPNVTCPMCRSAWKEDTETVLKKINRDKGSRREGYVNIGKQLGLSPTRDESTYLAWFHGRSRWH